ncbi:MAG: energy transducer TonB [Flavobacteriales bacterium]
MRGTLLSLLLLCGGSCVAQQDSVCRPLPPGTSHYAPWQGEDVWENITVDEQAQFPGGEEARAHFIAANLHYPEDIGCAEGKVYVEFVVERDGTIGPARVLRGFIPELDEEAVRVVKLLPRHLPAKIDGKPVRVIYRLPVVFELD